MVDTLQMVRGITYDNAYARDYNDLKALKQIADTNEIAILLIHHLRKESDDDPFNRISGTTAIQGAVDSSFTLVETRRGSGFATLTGIGRDIMYREIEMQKDADNIWVMKSDSLGIPDKLKSDIVPLALELLRHQGQHYKCSPNELAKQLNNICPDSANPFTDRTITRLLKQSESELSSLGIVFRARRSNGKRLIELHHDSDDGDGDTGVSPTPQISDPVDPDCLAEVAILPLPPPRAPDLPLVRARNDEVGDNLVPPFRSRTGQI